jgi:hypothetical protein
MPIVQPCALHHFVVLFFPDFPAAVVHLADDKRPSMSLAFKAFRENHLIPQGDVDSLITRL